MSYENLSFVDYRNNFYQTSDHALVDVRSASEYRQGHVPGAINIPLEQLPTRAQSEITGDKPVVVICASGNRSKSGSKFFKEAGYDRVYNLQGGTMVWMMNGLPLDN